MTLRNILCAILLGALSVMHNTDLTLAAETAHADAPHTAAAFIQRELAKGRKPNRLIHEKSPYLLQHAFNPVDWYPWGEEAFARARELKLPIFLSIGYSTCHWCHVMAHESFDDPEIGALLNANFICIKVDREERPDIDQIYMAAAQALTGSGGWPLSVFLTPELQPFYAGTYFPPEARYGQPAFRTVLTSLHELWTNQRDKVLHSAGQLTAHLQASVATASATTAAKLDEALLTKTVSQFAASFDQQYGGFGQAPKFPRPASYTFLLRQYHRTGEQRALDMVTTTLDHMAAGGLYDHLGGGFHRYSTDREWLVPHFEKMLYDQAQLATSYLEGFQLTGNLHYAEVARQTLDYVLRDLTSPQGGFFSAEDADSPRPDDPTKHAEGAFYLWTKKEIDALLGPKVAPIFDFHYTIQAAGNITHASAEEFGIGNILHTPHSLEETAKHGKLSVPETEKLLDSGRQILFQARTKRPRSHLDDKVVTAWNGLMISSLAKGAMVLDEPRYLAAAQKAAGFILATLRDEKTNTLMRRYRDGTAGLEAQLDDYAFLCQGVLDLYEASFDPGWLQAAEALTRKQLELFWDENNNGFFDTTANSSNRILRMKSQYEGAEPGGNAVAAMNLMRLAEMTGNSDWAEKARSTITSAGAIDHTQPLAMPRMLAVLAFQLSPTQQIVIAGNPADAATQALRREVYSHFLPNATLLLADNGPGQATLAARLPFLKNMQPINGKPAAYVCQNHTCTLPVTTPRELAARLSKK